MTARIDYLEEYGSEAHLAFDITSILWIAPNAEPDVAFLRVAPGVNGAAPRPIALATSVAEDDFVAAIGYPAPRYYAWWQANARRSEGDLAEIAAGGRGGGTVRWPTAPRRAKSAGRR